ncbi:titin-like [Dendronephthya gigantea]|uniref:titin-like n=1 Tax=Dendronephthya gigantea TaxID=151771 RepID=UPI00106ACD28|nr:titin-like [Dendronephthya gigantea]
MDMLFKKEDETGIRELIAAVRNNSFGDFDLDRDALQVVITGACPPYGPDICPGNSTCATLTESTIKCPCIKDFYFDGVKCIRNVVVKAAIVLERKFTPSLKNENSEEYIELKENITNKLTETFKDTQNFERVEVTGFRNGSLVVEFRVIYRRDLDTNKKVVVGETLREKILKNKKLGEYKVKGDIFIKEPPPPPKSLNHSKVTKNRIDIRWEKPTANDFFKIFGYIVSHKEKSQLEYKTQNMTSGTFNVILSKLKSNTFYDIKVHGYNKEGSGDKIKISVKTKEEDSSNAVVVIIIVIIVVVLLIIVGILVFYKMRKSTRQRHREEPMRMGEMGEPKEFYNHGQKEDEMSRGDNPQS